MKLNDLIEALKVQLSATENVTKLVVEALKEESPADENSVAGARRNALRFYLTGYIAEQGLLNVLTYVEPLRVQPLKK